MPTGNFRRGQKKHKRMAKNIPWYMMGGRPPTLTDGLIDEFAKLLKTVMYLETIANYLGLDRQSVKNWIKRGRNEAKRCVQALEDGHDPTPLKSELVYLRFFCTYKKGLAESEINRLKIINKASHKLWTAAAWLLERNQPHRYGNNSREIRELQKQMLELQKQTSTTKEK